MLPYFDLEISYEYPYVNYLRFCKEIKRTIYDSKINGRFRALATFLKVGVSEVKKCIYPDNAYMVRGVEYLVLTDSERFETVKQLIIDNPVGISIISKIIDIPTKDLVDLNNYELVRKIETYGLIKFTEKVLDIYGYKYFLAPNGLEASIKFSYNREFFIYS